VSAGLLTWREGAFPLPATGLLPGDDGAPFEPGAHGPLRHALAFDHRCLAQPCCSQGGHPTEPIIAAGLARLMGDVAMRRRALLEGLLEWEKDDQASLLPVRSEADQRRVF
jgi:hypothetical protein